jgi:hypothetical protein
MKKFEEILEAYQIRYVLDEFLRFQEIPSSTVPRWFRKELQFALLHRGEDDKEAFTSEFLIVPFLREVWKHHADLELFSHVQISADDVTLVPDYLLSPKPPSGYKTLHKPLLLTVEAKDEKFDEGWAQALLQSVVCQKINGDTSLPVYSIVTTGDTWQFGKIEQALFTKHPVPVALQPAGKLLGILDVIFVLCERGLSMHTGTG